MTKDIIKQKLINVGISLYKGEIEYSTADGLIDELLCKHDNLVKKLTMPVVGQQSELFISFARFVENYGEKKYETPYEDMFKQWEKQRNI